VKKMKIIGILLLVLGIIGLVMGMMMFGDIGIACIVGALSAILSGIGFLQVAKKL
jgi:membrane protein implicated in regulation of membrane protease activity